MNHSNNIKHDLLKDSNLTQTIERGFAECHPLQFVRELLQNSIEAGAKKVRIVYEKQAYKIKGINRAVFMDDGVGMASPDLMKKYAQFNSSGKIVGTMHDNFGIGAKISLLPFNQYGLVFMSWDKENPEGNMIWLCKNTSGKYGAKYFPVESWDDEEQEEYIDYLSCIHPHECKEEGIDWGQVLNDCKKLLRSDHGTAVILCGNHSIDNTGHYTGYDFNTNALQQWNNFITQRFVNVPLDLWIYINHSQTRDIRTTLRTNGLIGNYEGSYQTFMIPIQNGRVTLYLKQELKENQRKTRGARACFTSGFVYKNEVYYTTYGNQFAGSWGVGASREIAKRLIILVEFNAFDGKQAGIIPSQSRSNLIWKDVNHPANEKEAYKQTIKFQMDEAKRQVRDNLPQELVELIRENTPESDSVKAEDVLKEYGDLFKPTRIRRQKGSETEVLVKNKEGDLFIDGISKDSQTRLPLGKEGTAVSTGEGTPHSLETIGDESPGGQIPALTRLRNRQKKKITPTVQWMNDEQGEDDHRSYFEEDSGQKTFARYSGGLNPSLILNQDWFILKAYQNKILNEYVRKQDEPAILEIIKTEIEKSALASVLHILGSKKHGFSQDPKDIERAVTMGFLGGHQTLTTIRHALSKKTGIKKK